MLCENVEHTNIAENFFLVLRISQAYNRLHRMGKHPGSWPPNHLNFSLVSQPIVLYNNSLKGIKMATEKIVNYTPEQVTQMVQEYTQAPTKDTVDHLAEVMGKTARSIVAKLAKEGVYVSKAKEAGKREMLKAEMVAEISKLTGKTEEQLESLEKATGPALMVVLSALRTSVKE